MPVERKSTHFPKKKLEMIVPTLNPSVYLAPLLVVFAGMSLRLKKGAQYYIAFDISKQR
jgi:hypothetical protein